MSYGKVSCSVPNMIETLKKAGRGLLVHTFGSNVKKSSHTVKFMFLALKN